MQRLLDMLPAGHHEAFGISDVINPECLDRARATAFTWAERPGSVCLGLNRKYFDEAVANPNIVAPRAAMTTPPAEKAVILAEKAD